MIGWAFGHRIARERHLATQPIARQFQQQFSVRPREARYVPRSHSRDLAAIAGDRTLVFEIRQAMVIERPGRNARTFGRLVLPAPDVRSDPLDFDHEVPVRRRVQNRPAIDGANMTKRHVAESSGDMQPIYSHECAGSSRPPLLGKDRCQFLAYDAGRIACACGLHPELHLTGLIGAGLDTKGQCLAGRDRDCNGVKADRFAEDRRRGDAARPDTHRRHLGRHCRGQDDLAVGSLARVGHLHFVGRILANGDRLDEVGHGDRQFAGAGRWCRRRRAA